jgi:hypothetical protein
VAAEPYRVPDSPNCVGDLYETAAVGWMTTTTPSIPGALLERGNNYVAVEWAGIAVVGVYVSPNSGRTLSESSSMECVRRRCRPHQVLVLGDFNARST